MNKIKVKAIVFIDLLYKYIILWVVFILALLFSIWIDFPERYIETSFSNETCYTINSIIQNLSFSVVAGVIIFVFSEFIPSLKKRYDNFTSIANLLFQIDEDLKSIIAVSVSDKEYSRDFDAKSFLSRILQDDISSCNTEEDMITEDYENYVHLVPAYIYAICMIVDQINVLINSLSFLFQSMKAEEISLLMKLKSSELFQEFGKKGMDYSLKYRKDDITINYGMLKQALYDYNYYRNEVEHITEEYKKYRIK